MIQTQHDIFFRLHHGFDIGIRMEIEHAQKTALFGTVRILRLDIKAGISSQSTLKNGEKSVISLITGSYLQSHLKFESTQDLALRWIFINHNNSNNRSNNNNNNNNNKNNDKNNKQFIQTSSNLIFCLLYNHIPLFQDTT